jgi:hypothetical protein
MISVTSQEPQEERTVRRGQNGNYHWLAATCDVYMGTLLSLCPEAVLNRYLAVTSYDSGVSRLLSEEQVSAGWVRAGDVGYSPLITSVDSLRFQDDGPGYPRYEEWYVFPERRELGEVFHGNFFDFRPGAGQIPVFVNMFAFVLHDPAQNRHGILDIFWNQLPSVGPETFIADGEHCLTLVTRKEELVLRFQERLSTLP